jgi:transaldolase/glucose-6-phosphate isomerase
MPHSAKQKVFTGALKNEYETYLEKAHNINLIGEIIRKNPGVFNKREKSHQKVIANRLGWIDAIREMPNQLEKIENFVQQVRASGVRHLFVLGMGGSSLCPEVFGKMFDKRKWLKSYTVIDTTAPGMIDSILKKTDLGKSFFIVSSKSGSTIETISQYRFFFKRIKTLRPLKAGDCFAAITDDGSDLHRIARRNRFREIFLNRSDIGGRYSALSFFGLAPGAFTNANLREIVRRAGAFLDLLETKANDNDALTLGTLMGCGANRGFDKLIFRASPRTAPFIPWIEQLVAESTGKEKKGIIPIEGLINGASGGCADDCIYVHYRMRGERQPAQAAKNVDKNEAPRVVIETEEPHSVGAEMLKWEMATVAASTILGVNPFDEPNVAESKKNTAAIIKTKRSHRKIAPQPPLPDCGAIDIKSVSDIKGMRGKRKLTPEEILRKFLDGVNKGDYLSILCYTEMTPEIEERLVELRTAFEKEICAVTLRGYGPRFLHSVGQLYKGGSPKGHFLVLEREYRTDYKIPKLNISFGKLIKAQAEGDIRALKKRKRPLINIGLKNDPVAGLDRLLELVKARQVSD